MADGAPENGSTPPPPPPPYGGPPPPPPVPAPPPVPGQAAPGWGAGPPPSYPAPGYAAPGYGSPGYGAPAPATPSKTSGLAIAALVLGILSIPFFFVIVVGLLAFVLGLVASGSIKRSNGARSGRGMARAGWILGLLSMLVMAGFVALVATGVVEDGTNVFDLEVGQCVDLDPGDADEIFSLPTVDCTTPHDGEVYFVGELDGFGDEFPGDAAIRADIELRCIGDPFAEYVGIPYADSVYGLYSLSPTEESWSDGDRGYICIATGDDLVGSIQGTER